MSPTITSLTNNYYGSVLGPSGKMYFVPLKQDNIGVLDTATDQFSTIDISAVEDADDKYGGGVHCSHKIFIYYYP